MAFFVHNDLPILFRSPDFYSKDLLNCLFENKVITGKEAKYIRSVMTARTPNRSDYAAVKDIYDTKISAYFRQKIEEAQKND